jgi:predicted phage baseplate assembly protein
VPLPVPNLDDRRFQSLVDDAKRLVQQRCPEWTDHNVSDPGVTLIETFAYMTDLLCYRLNRIPERHYVKFLELIGVRLYPPTAARVPVTFWLSAPQDQTVTVPAGTRVATVRGERPEDVVTFTTLSDLALVPARLERAESIDQGGLERDHTDRVGVASFNAFSSPPQPGDVLLVGLSEPAPSCAVVLRFDCDIEGVGVDPSHPPVVWEAFDGEDWEACEVERDETGGLNRAGDVVLHVPATHVASLHRQRRAGWLRCRVVAPEPGQAFYSSSPRVNRLAAFVIGGTVVAEHAEVVRDEVLGVSNGAPGQCFTLLHRPVVAAREPGIVEVATEEGWQEWREVDDFGDSSASDRHFVLDRVAGEVLFGPAVRRPDGGLDYHGAVPPKGAVLRLREYHHGGGRAGNVARGAVSVLKTSIPFVARVENRAPAAGGVDGEDLEAAKLRGPILLRTRGRAVTAEDYEHLAREAAPEAARVRAVAADSAEDAGVVRVLVVPAVQGTDGRLRFEDLVPPTEMLERIAHHLERRRTIGVRVVVEPPVYQGVTVVAEVRARPGADSQRLEAEAVSALYRYLHPVTGGPAGDGWPFGRPVHVGEVYAVLQRLEGTELVESARLYAADPLTGERGRALQRIELHPHALVFGYDHQVRVESS